MHSSYLQSTAFPPPPPAILGRLTLPRWYFRSSHSDGLGFHCNSSLQYAGESSAAAPNFWQGWWVQDGRLKGTDLTQLCIALDKAELCPKAELYFQLSPLGADGHAYSIEQYSDHYNTSLIIASPKTLDPLAAFSLPHILGFRLLEYGQSRCGA